jgi:hypothetical protein
MSEAHTSEARTGGNVWSAIRCDSGGAAPGVARLLGLAAAPTFAIMALLSSVNGGAPQMLCLPAQDPSPLSGMALMYLLMSVFHSAPWLKLVRSGQGGIHRS